ncbi:MAG TPA: GDYXXLXY domain-containing protein [Burkholderiales bacterium]
MRSAIAIISCVAVLALVNFSIVGKERQLESGKVVYLELAPVDPRSLMQGDYMALRFKIANAARPAMDRAEPGGVRRFARPGDLAAADGRIVVALDPSSIATYRRLDDGTPPAPNEILLRYRVREGQIKFATNAFFFQEGSAKRYEGARYGEFRVAPDGELLLTGLRDKELKPL